MTELVVEFQADCKGKFFQVKFRFSKKATKFGKISHWILLFTYMLGYFPQIFVAFLENLNVRDNRVSNPD